jgi:hypothetical protein
VKLDTHVHTVIPAPPQFSLQSLHARVANTPESVYANGNEARHGSRHVTDTTISGAPALGMRRRDHGCEVTAEWPDIDLCVHINVRHYAVAARGNQRLR